MPPAHIPIVKRIHIFPFGLKNTNSLTINEKEIIRFKITLQQSFPYGTAVQVGS